MLVANVEDIMAEQGDDLASALSSFRPRYQLAAWQRAGLRISQQLESADPHHCLIAAHLTYYTTAINDWRLWVTLSIVTALILNETVANIRDGQPIVAVLTRTPFYEAPYLLLVCGIVAQAGIGEIPFTIGAITTL